MAGQFSRWIQIQLMPRDENLPRVSACYAVYFNGVLQYIGSTVDLRNRFSEHAFRYGYARCMRTPWGDVDAETVVTVKYRPSRKYGDWLMVEARLIRRLQPAYNKMLKGRRVANG
jgi:excinuclease UvrABC nuclease subunit